MSNKLKTQQLNKIFVESLGDRVIKVADINSKPLLVDVQMGKIIRMRVYLFNCTNPPGGRAPDEYKCQLIMPGQQKGMRGNFDYSDERFVVLGGYAKPDDESGVFVLWDPMCHVDFSYSKNIQVKGGLIISTLWEHIVESDRKNGEKVIAARAEYLYEAISKRIRSISPVLEQSDNEE